MIISYSGQGLTISMQTATEFRHSQLSPLAADHPAVLEIHRVLADAGERIAAIARAVPAPAVQEAPAVIGAVFHASQGER